MLSFQLVEHYTIASSKIKELMYTIGHPIEFLNYYERTINGIAFDILGSSVSSSNDSNKVFTYSLNGKINYRDSIKRYINELRSIYKYSATIKMSAEARIILSATPLPEVNEILDSFDLFIENYECFMQDPSNENVISFIDNLRDINTLYRMFNKTYQILQDQVYDYSTLLIPDEKDVFDFQILDASLNFEDFIQVLDSINKIYNSFTHRLPNTSKLEIIKIESGSLYTKLLGDNGIVNFIICFFDKLINLFFAKTTLEGMAARHRDISEMLAGDIDILRKFQEMGIETSVSKEYLAEALQHVTLDAISIAKKSSHFRINGKNIEYGKRNKTEYLNAVKTPDLLETSEDATDSNCNNLELPASTIHDDKQPKECKSK